MGELEATQKILDLDDLEDRISVLESVVTDLQQSPLTQPQLEIVFSIQLLNQYIVLEDSLLAGFDYLSEETYDDEDKERLKTSANKFNLLGADFQDTWIDNYWTTYELIREGYKKVNFTQGEKGKSTADVSNQVTELQELAITMNRRSKNDDLSPKGDFALKEVDELAKQYDTSTIVPSIMEPKEEEKLEKKKCCTGCEIFQLSLPTLTYKII